MTNFTELKSCSNYIAVQQDVLCTDIFSMTTVCFSQCACGGFLNGNCLCLLSRVETWLM